MITAGIDSGSATTKAVILRDDKIAAYKIVPTGFDFLKAANTVYRSALRAAEVDETEIEGVYATGYGRSGIKFACKAISEITAHAKGVHFIFPEAQGIVDIGGQDSKVIALDGGKVTDFLMNDKCAAGTGKFLEHTARALEVSVEDLGSLALASKTPASINSMCTVFAESEVVSLRSRYFSKEDIAAGLVFSIAKRVATMAKRVGLKRNIAIVGGVAKNEGIRAALEKEFGVMLLMPFEPQITGALGAALYRQT